MHVTGCRVRGEGTLLGQKKTRAPVKRLHGEAHVIGITTTGAREPSGAPFLHLPKRTVSARVREPTAAPRGSLPGPVNEVRGSTRARRTEGTMRSLTRIWRISSGTPGGSEAFTEGVIATAACTCSGFEARGSARGEETSRRKRGGGLNERRRRGERKRTGKQQQGTAAA